MKKGEIDRVVFKNEQFFFLYKCGCHAPFVCFLPEPV